MRFGPLLVTFAAAVTCEAACATDGGQGILNAPCERESDCMSDLTCTRGVCTSGSETGAESGSLEGDATVSD